MPKESSTPIPQTEALAIAATHFATIEEFRSKQPPEDAARIGRHILFAYGRYINDPVGIDDRWIEWLSETANSTAAEDPELVIKTSLNYFTSDSARRPYIPLEDR